METSKCEAVLLAAESGSLTAAAEAMGYTQPGVTRMVRSLEAELGLTLLARTTHGVELTASGREMLPALREVTRAARRVEEESSQVRGVLRGELVVGSYYSLSARLLPGVLAGFCAEHPGVRVRVREGGNQEMARWLSERSVDLCFAATPAEGVACDWVPVLTDELVAWLPASHPRAHDAAFPVSALEGEPFVVTMQGQDTDIDRLLAEHGVTPDFRFSTSDAYATWCVVEAGLGMSMNQRLISACWEGSVAQVPFDPPQRVVLGIAVPSLSDASPSARAFVDCVRGMA